MALKALALNCTLKGADKGASSTGVLLSQMLDELGRHGVAGEIVEGLTGAPP